MSVTTGLFYVFSAIMLLAAFRVITARNPIHAVLFLVLTFFQAAMIWMLLKAEFLAITLVLVYVGAVMVLFLFVVMMMDINTDDVRRGFWKYFPFAAIVGVVIALEMSAVLMGGFRVLEDPTSMVVAPDGAQISNTKELGKVLYTQYVYPLEVATGILLVAMFAAIALTLRARKDSRAMSASDQVRVRSKDRLTVVKLAATQAAIVPAAGDAAQAEKKA